jgi:hypothetical protein
MDLRDKRVENAHLIPLLDKCIYQVRADKTGPASNQNVSFFQLLPRF